jgi:hypothetical protein
MDLDQHAEAASTWSAAGEQPSGGAPILVMKDHAMSTTKPNTAPDPVTTTTTSTNPNVRATVIRLTLELADQLEDFRYQEQRRRRARVTKRSVVEQALRHYFRATSSS